MFDHHNVPLSLAELRRCVPAAFGLSAGPRTSEKYAFIPTGNVVEKMMAEGFRVVEARQTGSRLHGNEAFARHMLRMRHGAHFMDRAGANEVILTNGHNGNGAYSLQAGYYRLVCKNGMIAFVPEIAVRVLHRGDIGDRVVEGALNIVSQFSLITKSRERMESITLDERAAQDFAQAALALRFGPSAPVTAQDILRPTRLGDEGRDLWSRFNVVQSHLMRGGVEGRSAAGRRIRTRPLTAIDSDINLNRSLWKLADETAIALA